jgi:hypothetical protein
MLKERRLRRTFQFDVDTVVEQLNRILQMELAAVRLECRPRRSVDAAALGGDAPDETKPVAAEDRAPQRSSSTEATTVRGLSG